MVIPLKPYGAAAWLNVAVADLPRLGAWSGKEVRHLRSERPDWLTRAWQDCPFHRQHRAEQQRVAHQAWLWPQPLHACLCWNTEFRFTIDSGGLCDTCNEGECPKQCVEPEEDWL